MTVNHGVVGSSPTGGAKNFPFLMEREIFLSKSQALNEKVVLPNGVVRPRKEDNIYILYASTFIL